jgi:hypothetical protein
MPPTNPSSSANLRCDQCEYLNEPERVYCHNCGAKLDRSLLPKGEEKKHEAPEAARKRISKMTNPQSGKVLNEVKMLIKMIVYAAVAAVLILVGQKPDGVPDPKGPPATRLVNSDLGDALQAPAPHAISFTEADVNQYLKQALKPKEGAIPGIEFKRAYVNLRPGAIRVARESSLWGYPLYSGVDFRVEVQDGKFKATVIGGHFGRLTLDPQIMQVGEYAFQNFWTGFQNQRKQMDRMSSVKVEEQRIVLVTKGAAAPR